MYNCLKYFKKCHEGELRHILKNSLSLRSIGIKEHAFNYNVVKKILASCQDNKIAILGGDVLALNDNKEPFYTHDNWSVNTDDYENYDSFVEASINKSYNYIESHRYKTDRLFVFVLCPTKADFIISKHSLS